MLFSYLNIGSRDNHMALWCIKDEEESGTTSRLKSLQVPEYYVTKPVVIRTCKKAEKVRAIAVNDDAKVKYRDRLYAVFTNSEADEKYANRNSNFTLPVLLCKLHC